MAANNIEEQSTEKKYSKKELNKFKNKVGCFLMIIIGIFILTYTVPGFLAYRQQRGVRRSRKMVSSYPKSSCGIQGKQERSQLSVKHP